MTIHCPECGTDLHDVVVTRTDRHRRGVPRVRQCFNGHQFKTLELVLRGPGPPVQDTARRRAIMAGKRTYQMDRPCRAGHQGEATVTNGCVECRRIRNRAHQAKWRDKQRSSK